MTPPRYVLLDRDGTIVVEREYLSEPEQLELIAGAASGLRKLRDLGLGLAVITNQSAIGRGYFTLQRLAEIHGRFNEMLAAEGIVLGGIYVCPHTPEDHCACRKPMPGLVEQASRELGFDPKTCFVIGDKPCDIELGQRFGATTLLVRTGHGSNYAAGSITADHVVDDLADAADIIERCLRDSKSKAE